MPLYRLKKMNKKIFDNFPNSEMYYKNNISLPIYVGLNKKSQMFIINKIDEFFKKYKKK